MFISLRERFFLYKEMFRVVRRFVKTASLSSRARPFAGPNMKLVARFSASAAKVEEYDEANEDIRDNGSYNISSPFPASVQFEDNIFNPLKVDFQDQFEIPFIDNFDYCDAKSVYEVPPGGFMDVNIDELDTLIPEGLSGEIEHQFSAALRSAWMIREPTKILCRIIDEFQGSQVDANTQHFAMKYNYEGLTNRPEWDDSKLKVFCNGVEVKRPEDKFIDEQTFVFGGESSPMEGYISGIKDKNKSELPKKVVLSGARGVGKSTILSQAVYHARKNGWLCLFVPNAWDHVQSGYYLDTVYGSNDTTLYDNPMMSTAALRSFFKAHKDVLKTLPVTQSPGLSKYSAIVDRYLASWKELNRHYSRGNLKFIGMRSMIEGDDAIPEEDDLDEPFLRNYDMFNIKIENVHDLLLFGIAFHEASGAVFMDLVEELKELKHIPVLIAVDQMNSWDAPSAFGNENGPVSGRDLCVPRALSFLTIHKADSANMQLKNGLFFAATSQRRNEGREITYYKNKNSMPLLLRVPNYNQVEFLACISYYVRQNILFNRLPRPEVLGFRMFSESNPRLMREQLGEYFAPLESRRSMNISVANYDNRALLTVFDEDEGDDDCIYLPDGDELELDERLVNYHERNVRHRLHVSGDEENYFAERIEGFNDIDDDDDDEDKFLVDNDDEEDSDYEQE